MLLETGQEEACLMPCIVSRICDSHFQLLKLDYASTILFEFDSFCNPFTIAEKYVVFCAILLTFTHDIISRYVAMFSGSSDPRFPPTHPDYRSSRVAQSARRALQHETGT